MRKNTYAFGAALLAALTACNSGTKLHHCNVDSECGGGICREGICAVDETAPVVTIEAPVANFLAASATIEVSGSVDDGATGTGVVSVSARLGDGEGVELKLEGGRFSGTLNVPVLDSKGIEIVVNAKDAAGNVGSATVAGVSDRLPPQIMFEPPSKKAFGAADVGTNATWKFTSTDGSGVVRAEVSSDGGQTWSTIDNGLSFTRDIAIEANVPDRDVSLSARAIDPSGNVSEVAVTPKVKIDTVAPALSIVAPPDGVLIALKDPPVVNVNGYVTDVNLVKVAGLGKEVDPTQMTPMGGFNIDQAVSIEDSVVHMYDITATDVAGNATTIHRTYVVDRVPPVLTMDTPAVDADCSNGPCTGAVVNVGRAKSFRFQGTIKDGGGILNDKIQLELDGVKHDIVVAPGSTTWTFDWTNAPVVDGKEYVAKVTAFDRAGNSSTVERKLWVDTVAPVVTALAKDNPHLPRAAPLFKYSEPMQAATVLGTAVLKPVTNFSLQSTDGMEFSFKAAGSSLAYATTYTLSLGLAGLDRAGNSPTSTFSERFRTEPFPADASKLPSLVGERPAAFTDPDGNPVVVYFDGAAQRFQLVYWNGDKGLWSSVTIPTPAGTVPCKRPTSLIFKEKRGSDLELQHSVQVAICSGSSASNVSIKYIASDDEFATWKGLAATSGADTVATSLTDKAAPVIDPGCIPLFGCSPNITFAEYNSGLGSSTVKKATYSAQSGWTSQKSMSSPAFTLGGGVAVGSSLFYLPTGTALAIPATGETLVDAYGQAQASNGVAQSGLAWALAAVSDNASGIHKLNLGCSPTPDQSASWVFQPQSLASGVKAMRVDLAASTTKVVMGVEDTDGVAFASVSVTPGCSATSFVLSAPIAQGYNPAVAVWGDKEYRFYADARTTTIRMAP